MTAHLKEEQLWAAVIRQAVVDATGNTSTLANHSSQTLNRVCQEARNWLLKPNDHFHYVCELAGKDPARIRKAVIELLADRNPNLKQHATKQRKAERPKQQRKRLTLTFKGKTQSISAWAEQTGLTYNTIKARIRCGWTVEAILTTPLIPRCYRNRFQHQHKRKKAPGVGLNFEDASGTGGGSTVQDLPKIGFSQKEAVE